jgi:hypothetical protein
METRVWVGRLGHEDELRSQDAYVVVSESPPAVAYWQEWVRGLDGRRVRITVEDLTDAEHPTEHSCPGCTCGMIELTWSDRKAFVFPHDFEQIADIVTGCALDHSYDRGEGGVPYGFDTNVTGRLRAVVAQHMIPKAGPKWESLSFSMTDEEHAALRSDVLAALKETR